MFPVDKKLVFTSQNEGLAEKNVPVEEKTASTNNSWLAEKSRKKEERKL